MKKLKRVKIYKKLKKVIIYKKLKRVKIYKKLKKVKIYRKLKLKRVKIYKKLKKVKFYFKNKGIKKHIDRYYSKIHSPEIQKIIDDDIQYNINVAYQNETFLKEFKRLDGESRYYINIGLLHWEDKREYWEKRGRVYKSDWCWIKDRVSRCLDTDWKAFFEKYDWREKKRREQARQMKLRELYNAQIEEEQKLKKQKEYMNLMGIKEKGEKEETKKELKKIEYNTKQKVTMKDYGLNAANIWDKNYFDVFVKDCLESLIETGLMPEYNATFKIIEYWNNLANTKISKIGLKKSSKVNKICVALTFLMYAHSLNFQDVIDGIDNFMKAINYGTLKFKKKYNLDTDFIYSDKKFTELDYFQLCCTKTFVEIIPHISNVKVKYMNTLLKRVIPSFIEHYYEDNKHLGLQEIYANYDTFAKFSDNLCIAHQTKNMGEWQDLYSGGLDNLIEAYFSFTQENIFWKDSGTPSINFILGDKIRLQFIRFIREYKGWGNFWNDLEKK